MSLGRKRMNDQTTFKRIANAYYNLGLERARLNDLSGAAGLLKQALHFNKYQTDARNLLGLIFYEMGETADALIQWVISMNLQPYENRADYYLEEVQRKPGQLELASQTVKKFNQALWQAQNGVEDLAIIQLTAIVSERPNYVKAQTLLALLYMQKNENVKAGRALMEVLKLDRNNSKALTLMDEVKKRTGKAEIEKNKLKNAFSHRQMEDDDVILPKTKKQATAGQVVLYLSAGLLIGLFSFYILLLPSIRKSYAVSANQRIAENSQALSDKNASYEDLNQRYNELEKNYAAVSEKLNAFEQQNADFTSMYQKLNGIVANYNGGALVQAATDYLTIDQNSEALQQEPLASMVAEVNRYMRNEGFSQLTTLGTNAWNGGDKAQAESYYNLALSIRPDEPEAMYLKARLLQSQDRSAEANAIFDKIVGEHPESPYAERAQAARGY